VNLVPKPKHAMMGILAFDDLSAACDSVPRLLKLGPSAIELVPRLILEAARRIPGFARQMQWLRGDPTAILVIEFAGERPQRIGQRD